MDTGSTAHSASKGETVLALRNGAKLAFSLFVTLGVAFVVRFWMPGYLGPQEFGLLHFAEGFTFTFFILTHLGAETYIRKEVSTRPGHASDFFGSVMIIRFAMAFLMIGGMALALLAMGKEQNQWPVVFAFAAGQMFFVTNGIFAALLQARGTVNELAVVNAISKIIWGASVVIGLLIYRNPLVVGVAFFATELAKAPYLYLVCKRRLDLRLVVDWAAGRTMLAASLPFFINYVATSIYARIDATMISAMTNDEEVGWYGAAANVNNVVFLIMPVLTAVVIPMSSRIAQVSEEALHETMRAAVRMVLIITMPMALLVTLNAQGLVELLFGASYLPSVNSLRVLSAIVPLTFLCMLTSTHLFQINKVWKVTAISLAGLVLNPTLNFMLIPVFHERFGNGGAGWAASTTTVATEVLVAVFLFLALGRASFDRKTALLCVRLSVAGGVVAAAHVALAFLGPVRGLVEVALYPIVAVPLGALPLRDLLGLAKDALRRRRERRRT